MGPRATPAILHLPVRLIILADKADKVFPGLEYIPVEKYPHPGEKLVPAADARPRLLIPSIQQQHRYLHADIAYTTALRLDPGSALWWYRLGQVRESADDAVPAAEAYERALRINPAYREAGDGPARVRG